MSRTTSYASGSRFSTSVIARASARLSPARTPSASVSRVQSRRPAIAAMLVRLRRTPAGFSPASARRATASSVGDSLSYRSSLRPCIAWCSQPRSAATLAEGALVRCRLESGGALDGLGVLHLRLGHGPRVADARRECERDETGGHREAGAARPAPAA